MRKSASAGVLAVALLTCSPAFADVAAAATMTSTGLHRVHAVAHFDRTAGQAAESIAPEPGGSVLVGMIPARQVVRVQRDGSVHVLVTMPLPPGPATTPVVGTPVVTGVARTRRGGEYFLYSAGREGVTGIWQLRPAGPPRLVAPLPADALANALIVDEQRSRFLVTDSARGRIFSVPLHGGKTEVWSADRALAPTSFFGANGLKLHDGAVWVSNSDRGTLLRIPVSGRGDAGRAQERAGDLAGIDDFDFTGIGDEVVAAINQANMLVRVNADGTHDTLLDADDGMQGTTAVNIRGSRVYITNGANLTGDDPNLLRATLTRSRS